MAYAPDGGTLAYVITPGKTEVNKNSRRWFDGNFWYLCLRRRFAALRLVAAAQPASPDSDHASGRGEGNRGTRDRRRHRGGRNRGRGNKPQGGEPTPQA